MLLINELSLHNKFHAISKKSFFLSGFTAVGSNPNKWLWRFGHLYFDICLFVSNVWTKGVKSAADVGQRAVICEVSDGKKMGIRYLVSALFFQKRRVNCFCEELFCLNFSTIRCTVGLGTVKHKQFFFKWSTFLCLIPRGVESLTGRPPLSSFFAILFF